VPIPETSNFPWSEEPAFDTGSGQQAGVALDTLKGFTKDHVSGRRWGRYVHGRPGFT
jgi:hypothetical protein